MYVIPIPQCSNRASCRAALRFFRKNTAMTPLEFRAQRGG
jgi:hypothetical protein